MCFSTGVISRVDAENILIKKKIASYLVRVSERVWGYTISYRASDRCKHFLIETSESGYQFLGANQIAHTSLQDLVTFHQVCTIQIVNSRVSLIWTSPFYLKSVVHITEFPDR